MIPWQYYSSHPGIYRINGHARWNTLRYFFLYITAYQVSSMLLLKTVTIKAFVITAQSGKQGTRLEKENE
eukprot:6513761-Ditylum_brightwellii.AAC.1